VRVIYLHWLFLFQLLVINNISEDDQAFYSNEMGASD